MVKRLVRLCDQEERQSDAAVRWDTIRPKLVRAFADRGARYFSETVWLCPYQDTMNRIRARFEALNRATLRGRKHGHNQWQKDHAKADPSNSQQMAERRDFPSFSVGDRVD